MTNEWRNVLSHLCFAMQFAYQNLQRASNAISASAGPNTHTFPSHLKYKSFTASYIIAMEIILSK